MGAPKEAEGNRSDGASARRGNLLASTLAINSIPFPWGPAVPQSRSGWNGNRNTIPVAFSDTIRRVIEM